MANIAAGCSLLNILVLFINIRTGICNFPKKMAYLSVFYWKMSSSEERKEREEGFDEEREEGETMNRREPSMMYAYSTERAQN